METEKTTMQWDTILSPAQLDAHWELMAKLDYRFAMQSKKFWEEQTPAKLRALAAGAWDCNERESFVLAKSYAKRCEPVTVA